MTYAAGRPYTAHATLFQPLGSNHERLVISALDTTLIVSVSLIIVLVLILILGIPGSFAS